VDNTTPRAAASECLFRGTHHLTGDTVSDSTEVKKGGFGAFAEQYRERWAADHPDAARKAPPRIAPVLIPRPTLVAVTDPNE
jgi:hypothetical protein